ncbi:DUF1127 domain-containing protein [Yoonia sp. 208BN28-4]|uniref:DUF1127 domain-containing protein n=1 Tax=Yoonia sp. 208BN28-4 TaxID=3126505 RepID=UPI0030B5DCBE
MSLTTSHAPHTTVTAQIAHLNAQAKLPTLARFCVAVAVKVTKWESAFRTRRHLARLDPHELDDIGLTRHAAKTEADKPFWQD